MPTQRGRVRPSWRQRGLDSDQRRPGVGRPAAVRSRGLRPRRRGRSCAAEVESAINLTIDSARSMSPTSSPRSCSRFAADPGRPAASTCTRTPTTQCCYPKGPTCSRPSRRPRLNDHVADRAGERLRQPNIDAVWQGIAGASATGRQGQTLSVCVPADLRRDSQPGLWPGRSHLAGCSTRPLDRVIETRRALDVEELDRADTVLVFASIAPASCRGRPAGLSFRIEAPPGYDQQVKYDRQPAVLRRQRACR